ncbi:sigma-54-dependent Fis family transcriptional regulator [Oceanobacter mangrovi]|uniref:sigma-54-dependent Fis family transcriptional regulator n=1 Tax=Oceanobacter mangrovi TaxID=2862510 RepID=UPI001FECE6F0|nr:sigma-54-dependent Fis family transcriptional regulator [Oceanobacter mangrovi]
MTANRFAQAGTSESYDHTRVLMEFARDSSTIPPQDLISRSWWRCLQDYGLEPGRRQPARIVTASALREHQDAADELLAVARAGVEQLYAGIAELGYVLLLTDRQGVAVQFHGQAKYREPLRQAGLYLGADWSELHAGTCAVGTCIQEQTALTCHRGDHFDGAHISLTCTAAPIFDPAGELMAVLDISALNSPYPRDSQTFALHLTRMYAHMIEDAYFLRRYRQHTIFRCDDSRELVSLNGRILLALNDDGLVLAGNTTGRRWLQQVGGPGASIESLLATSWSEILAAHHLSHDGVTALQLLGQQVFGTLIQPVVSSRQLVAGSSVELDRVPELDSLAGDDVAMRKTLQQAKRFRKRDVNLLLLGETGTGKDVLANAIHRSGHRSNAPFVAVNCAAIPESLIESELFGYAAGAFTGARSKGAPGLIQQADGGTLFLDEIGDMPLLLQTRLLRVLAEHSVTPLGASQPQAVNCRVIAATHQNLPALIETGRFRADLYYRLNGATLTLPPLRQRSDCEYLMRRLLKKLQQQVGRARLALRADAVSALLGWHWPGNVRELVNVLAYAEAHSESGLIGVDDLPDDLHPENSLPMLNNLVHPVEARETLADSLSESIIDESHQLAGLLVDNDWNLSAVARQLNISRPTLYRRIQRYGIRRTTCIGTH